MESLFVDACKVSSDLTVITMNPFVLNNVSYNVTHGFCIENEQNEVKIEKVG